MIEKRTYQNGGTMNDFDEYLVAGEPDKRERAYGWATAIGLQDVDGLKVSDFLLNTARRNIEGEITQAEAGKIIDAYYETKEGHDQPADRKEADKVARRINETINSPTFRFSPEYYLGLHGRLACRVRAWDAKGGSSKEFAST